MRPSEKLGNGPRQEEDVIARVTRLSEGDQVLRPSTFATGRVSST